MARTTESEPRIAGATLWLALAAATLPAPAIADATAAAELPLSRVVLSTSGLAQFDHQGEVTGDATLRLPMRLDQVDDVLKSLVIYDDLGQLGEISVPGRETLAQSFSDLPFSQAELASPTTLLNALRGAEVEITGDPPVSGLLVSVVGQNTNAVFQQQASPSHLITVMTDSGLHSERLDDLSALSFTDAELAGQLKLGLKAMFANRRRDQREMNIRLYGEGPRKVALSYLAEAPLWKSTYRITLPDPGVNRARLQGWAVLENRTGQDWKDIEISLVSGNPVTYRQSLYQSYTLPRQSLPISVMGQVSPKLGTSFSSLHNEDLSHLSAEERLQRALIRELERNPSKLLALQAISTGADGSVMATGQSSAGGSLFEGIGIRPSPTPDNSGFGLDFMQRPQSVALPVAHGQRLHTEGMAQLIYTFKHPLSLKPNHTAMLPLVQRDFPVERLWMLEKSTHETHPLAALHIQNDSQDSLPPGILTIYASTAAGPGFLGDSALPVISPQDEHLLSYALDREISVASAKVSTKTLVSASLKDNMLFKHLEYRDITRFEVVNKGRNSGILLLTIPTKEEWKPAPVEGEVTRKDNEWHFRTQIPEADTSQHDFVLHQIRKFRVSWEHSEVSELTEIADKVREDSPELALQIDDVVHVRGEIYRVSDQLTASKANLMVARDQVDYTQSLLNDESDKDMTKELTARAQDQLKRVYSLSNEIAELELELDRHKAMYKQLTKEPMVTDSPSTSTINEFPFETLVPKAEDSRNRRPVTGD